MTIQQTRTKWGRTKFGSGRTPAMALAVPAGLLLAAALGGLSVLSGIMDSNPLLGGLIFALCLAMPAVALVYAVVVDRSTLEGAADRPEESVESGWYDRAAAGAFTDVILVAGVAATVLAFIPADLFVDLKLVLPAILAACFIFFGIRYLIIKRRG